MIPLLKGSSLTIGNVESPIAICTLWADQNRIVEKLDKSEYAIVGNLYSREGVNYLFRNLLAWSHIRYLYLLGPDRSHTGNMLHQFFSTVERMDLTTVLDIWKRNGFTLDPAFTEHTLVQLRHQIQLIDFRTNATEEGLNYVIAKIPEYSKNSLDHHACDYVCSPVDLTLGMKGKPKVRLPYHSTGVLFRKPTMRQSWPYLARHLFRHGEEVVTDKSTYLQSIGVTTIIESPEIALDSFYLPEWGITKEQALEYVERFWTGEKDPSLHYEYGERLNRYPYTCKHGVDTDIDQFDAMVTALNTISSGRRGYVSLWKVGENGGGDDEFDTGAENPPCLTSLLGTIADGKVSLTASFRSHDLFAWPMNVILLSEILLRLSRETDTTQGTLTIHSENLHVYQERWDVLESVANNKRYFSVSRFENDVAGYFLIEVNPATSVVFAHHGTERGGMSGNVFFGSEAEDLVRQVIGSGLVTSLQHAGYLGSEIRRAFNCLSTGTEYIQDK